MKKINLFNNKISVIILNYNSEKTIVKAVTSAKLLADQIIVVDSGSTDNSLELVTRLGCELYFRKWTDNFAIQRNYALNFARGQWILMLDSDEYISKFDFETFQTIDKNSNIGGINFNIKNTIDNGKNYIYHRYTRMFRAHKGFLFDGAIHEQIRSSIENTGYNIIESDFEIIHTGYSIVSEDKLDRNIRMLEKENDTDINNDYIKYHLASSYFAKDDTARSKAIFEELTTSRQLSQEQLDTVYIRLAQIGIKNNDEKAVIEYTKHKPKDDNLLGLRNFILSTIFLANKDYQEAYTLLIDATTSNSTLVDNKLLQQTILALKNLI